MTKLKNKFKNIINLTNRENDVLKLIALGKTNREIADELGFTEHTAKAHVGSIISKLQVKNRLEAALFAYKSGYLRKLNRLQDSEQP